MCGPYWGIINCISYYFFGCFSSNRESLHPAWICIDQNQQISGFVSTSGFNFSKIYLNFFECQGSCLWILSCCWGLETGFLWIHVEHLSVTEAHKVKSGNKEMNTQQQCHSTFSEMDVIVWLLYHRMSQSLRKENSPSWQNLSLVFIWCSFCVSPL